MADIVVIPATPTPNHTRATSAQYNTPNLDFLYETREAMDKFLNLCVPLHKLALEGNWNAAKLIIDKDEKLKHAAIAKGYPTVLHIAAGASASAAHVHFVQELLDLLEDRHIALQDYKGNTAFCFAAAAGNLPIVKLMLERNTRLPRIRGGGGVTPVQFAALQGRCEMAWYLYDMTVPEFEDKDFELLFFTCVNTGNYGLALRMVREHPTLALARDENDETALHLLAQKLSNSCNCPSPEHQTHQTPIYRPSPEHQTPINGPSPEHQTHQALINRPSPEHQTHQTPINGPSPEHQTPIYRPSPEHQTHQTPVNRPSPEHQTPIMINPGMKQQVVFQLVKFLWTTILKTKVSKLEIIEIINKPSQLLFSAAEVGNFGFLSELISAYPNLIWETDDRNRSIIHMAVLRRHASVYNLVHEIGCQRDIIATFVESTEKNTLLHLAARLAPQSQLELVSGAAFQMCLELLWFQEVKKIMPPSLIKSRNSQDLTASELFSKEHAELRKNAESWMKGTAESCMLIATVIATGVFTAAISIPGGISDGTGADNIDPGKPNYLEKPSFLVFAISDAIAFISSATSILIFMSILVSRYAEYDFYKSLPLKLIFGLVTLFLSVTSMMVAFGSSFFITYYYGLKWVPSFVSAFACLPILLFMLLQYSLWSDIMYSTYYCRNLFKPSKKMLYVVEK